MAKKIVPTLILFLVAQVAFAAPGLCCCPRLPAAKTVRAADCCAAMPACQSSLLSASPSAVVSHDRTTPTASRLAPDHSAVPSPNFAAQLAERAPLFISCLGPPLYRLHAQLLI